MFSEATCKTVANILEEGVATDGGSKAAYVPGFRIAAKTGTSEKKDIDDSKLGYIPYVCSAVAFAPAEKPEVSVLFMVDEPTEGVLYASVIAAPYVGSLLEEILPYVGVNAEYEEGEIKPLSAPWLVGANIGTAQNLAEMMGFEVVIMGDGDKVKEQSPAMGTLVDKTNAKIILYTTDEAVKEKQTVKVPSLEGLTAVATNGTLTNLGLNIRVLGTPNYYKDGVVVLKQSIAPGEVVDVGTVIEVTFGDPKDSDLTYDSE